MARRKSSRRRSWSGCKCPAGSRRISTGGRGRGWACQSSKAKRIKGRLIKKPFVRATCR